MNSLGGGGGGREGEGGEREGRGREGGGKNSLAIMDDDIDLTFLWYYDIVVVSFFFCFDRYA